MRLQSDQLELLKKSFPRHQPEPEKAFLLPAYRDGKFRQRSGGDAEGLRFSRDGKALLPGFSGQVADPEPQRFFFPGNHRIVEKFHGVMTESCKLPGNLLRRKRAVKCFEFVDRSAESAPPRGIRSEGEGVLKLQRPGGTALLRNQMAVEVEFDDVAIPGQRDMVPLPGKQLADPGIVVEFAHRHPFQKRPPVEPEQAREKQRPDPAGAVEAAAPDAVFIRVPVAEVQTAPRGGILADPERESAPVFFQHRIIHPVDQAAIGRNVHSPAPDAGDGFDIPNLNRGPPADGEIPVETAVLEWRRRRRKGEGSGEQGDRQQSYVSHRFHS